MNGSTYLRVAASVLVRIAIALAVLGPGDIQGPAGREAGGHQNVVERPPSAPSPAYTEGIRTTGALLRDASGPRPGTAIRTGTAAHPERPSAASVTFRRP